jgi:predicted phosphodiesterase
MIVGILSDIHANLTALEAVLADARGFAVDRWLCVGDTVGYGPDPAQCVAWVRKNCEVVVLGNHDAAVAGVIAPEEFLNDDAVAAVRTHTNILSEEDRDWLAGLEKANRWDPGGLFLVHGAPTAAPLLDYLVWDVTPGQVLEATREWMVVVGHTHIPCLYEDHAAAGTAPLVAFGARVPEDPIALRADSRYLLNPGSVGQPRDRDPRAGYAIWDATARTP